jgi:hypothetical protein
LKKTAKREKKFEKPKKPCRNPILPGLFEFSDPS